MATATSLMTTEEMMALPDDGTERWLIAGELRERSKERAMTRRNRFHCAVTTRVARFLDCWLDEQPGPRGKILTGEAEVILQRNPDSAVGVDVTYVSADLMARQTEDSAQIEGIPTLVVEILSPNDTIEEVNEKIDTYLTAGVPLVWIIDPYRRTVTVYRPDAEPELFTVRSELTAEPHLPGFRISVARLFE